MGLVTVTLGLVGWGGGGGGEGLWWAVRLVQIERAREGLWLFGRKSKGKGGGRDDEGRSRGECGEGGVRSDFSVLEG